MGILEGSINVSFIKCWNKLYRWICTKPEVNPVIYIFRSILLWAKLWISYFYRQQVTCTGACKVMCLWSDELVTVRWAEPKHLRTMLTYSIDKHVSELSSGSFSLRVSAWSKHSWNFIKCAYFTFSNAKKMKTTHFRKHTLLCVSYTQLY